MAVRAYIVDTRAVAKNLDLIKKKAGDAAIIAVLKADGYGLGLNAMADLCRQNGITRFAVTEVADVRRLRQSGSKEEDILMLRPTADPGEIRALLEQDAMLTVASQQDAVTIAGIAREMGLRGKVHLKIDTGMGRYGFLPEEKDKILSCYAYLDCMEICGLYTHFHSAFCNKKATQKQKEAFLSVVEAIRLEGFEPGLLHCANSSALMKDKTCALDAVRVGSAILGRLAFRTGLERIGYCQVSVDEVRWLPKGHTTGYGAAWKAKKPTQIAVLPVGWYHGYTTTYGDDVFRFRDRMRKVMGAVKGLLFPKRLTVLINGKKCRVLGHVGMLHTVVDVTGKNIQPGDEAIVDINPARVRSMEIKFM